MPVFIEYWRGDVRDKRAVYFPDIYGRGESPLPDAMRLLPTATAAPVAPHSHGPDDWSLGTGL